MNSLDIQKVEKGNTKVILDKLVETILKDSSEFKYIPVAPDKDRNYVINTEKESLIFKKTLKNKNAISEETNNKLGPVCSKPRTLYVSAKVYKPLKMHYRHSDPLFSYWYPCIETDKILSSRSV